MRGNRGLDIILDEEEEADLEGDANSMNSKDHPNTNLNEEGSICFFRRDNGDREEDPAETLMANNDDQLD